MAAEQHVGGGAHGAQVERVAHVPGDGRQQRIGDGRVPDQVAIAAAGGRAAGVEVGPDLLGPAHHHLGRQLAVEGPGQARPVEGDGGQVDVDDLAPGVHAGVGAPGAGEDRGLAQAGGALEGLAQRAGHGRDLGLDGEAAEGRTVVGDQQPPALRRSAGALAPPL